MSGRTEGAPGGEGFRFPIMPPLSGSVRISDLCSHQHLWCPPLCFSGWPLPIGGHCPLKGEALRMGNVEGVLSLYRERLWSDSEERSRTPLSKVIAKISTGEKTGGCINLTFCDFVEGVCMSSSKLGALATHWPPCSLGCPFSLTNFLICKIAPLLQGWFFIFFFSLILE